VEQCLFLLACFPESHAHLFFSPLKFKISRYWGLSLQFSSGLPINVGDAVDGVEGDGAVGLGGLGDPEEQKPQEATQASPTFEELDLSSLKQYLLMREALFFKVSQPQPRVFSGSIRSWILNPRSSSQGQKLHVA
jgi:hypothetical protein